MATILSVGNAQIPSERAQEYVEAVGAAVTSSLGLPPALRSVYNIQLDPVQVTQKDKPEITLFVFTAPDKTTNQKRAAIQNLKAAFDEFFGPDEVTLIVIFKIHTDDNVGVNGVLREDAKKGKAN